MTLKVRENIQMLASLYLDGSNPSFHEDFLKDIQQLNF